MTTATPTTRPASGIVLERDTLRAENEAMREMLADLTRYLTSDKFSVDPTVQARDVLNRIGR